jgi:hypothetical protein
MGKGHFVSKPGKEFDWKGFQKHMGYSEKELKAIQNDPVRSEYVQQICSPEMQDKYMIAEIVESHGCAAGMKPGDRLYFKGMSVLDPERSDPWCPYIVNTFWFAADSRNLVRQGLDPNSVYVNYSGCIDVGPENGLGRVVYKVFVVDKSELDRLDKGRAKRKKDK